MFGALKAGLIACLFIAYPFIGAYLSRHGFASLELLLFAALTLWRGMSLNKLMLRLASALLAYGVLLGAFIADRELIWLLPSFIYLWLAAFFGHSLWSPPSLLERLVRLQFPEFKPGIAEYLRQLTWVWTGFFALNVPLCALLVPLAGQDIWAIYTGVVIYLLMGILGVGEWFYRHHRFPDLEIPPALETFKVMARDGHKLFRDD